MSCIKYPFNNFFGRNTLMTSQKVIKYQLLLSIISVKCSDRSITINENNNNSSRITDTTITYAYDIRVEPFARVVTRYAKQTYQLSVDISWQLPPNSSYIIFSLNLLITIIISLISLE